MSIFSFLMKLWNWRDRNGVYHSFFKYSSVKPKSENEKTMCYFIIGLWIWYKKICFVFSYFHFMLRPKKGTETSQGLNLILIFITLYYRKYVFFHFLILVSLLNIKRRNDTQTEMPAWIPIPGRWRRQRHFFKFYHDCISMDNKENKFTAIPLNK